jgi:hypothetical protein
LKGNLKNISSGNALELINDNTVFFLVKKDKKNLIENQVHESNHPFILKEFKEWVVFVVRNKV